MTVLPKHPSTVLRDVWQDMVDRHGQPKELSLNFWPELDDKIWGLRKKRLVVIGGRPSMGKSTFMLNSARAIAEQGKKVVFFTLEMTTHECVQRMFNEKCEVNNWYNIAGIPPDQVATLQPKMETFYQSIKNQNIAFIESYGKTFKEIFDVIESFGTKIDAVFIDYLQMIKGGNSQTDKQAIDEYIKKLREYALKRDFCAIIGSQISRATYDGKKVTPPELWELKSSGAIEEVCDMCILLHWYNFYDKDTERNKYWAKVAKNRGGRTGVLHGEYYPEYFKITGAKKDGQEHAGEDRYCD